MIYAGIAVPLATATLHWYFIIQPTLSNTFALYTETRLPNPKFPSLSETVRGQPPICPIHAPYA